MRRVIQTVCGEIVPERLGFCHSHEHILLARCRGSGLNPALCMDDKHKSLEELELFASAGGGALVDAQPPGCGRMSPGLSEISEKSGVNIIASTGFHKMIFYHEDHWIFSYGAEEIAAVFTHELQNGMFVGTDDSEPRDFHAAKAGVIKTALDSCGLNRQYKKLFGAAARAHERTGAPLLIHVESGSDPLELDAFLDQNGVAASKRIYCHLDRAVPNPDIHTELLKRGCYLEYDTINRPKYHDNEAEVSIIKSRLEDGFESRVLLGLDTTNERLKAYGGKMGLDYIKTSFIPLAISMGVPEYAITELMESNPQNAFAISR